MLSLLSIFHIVKRLSKLRFRRSPMFEQGRTARVLRFIGSTFAFLYLVIVGMLLGLATRGESDGPVLLMAMVPLMLIVDFMLRFVTQEMPEMQLRPWLLLPVPRRKVVEAFLLADILSSYNLIWLAAFVPFGIVAVVVGQQPWAVLCAVAGCQVLMMANSLFWVSVRLLMAHRVLWLMLAAVVYGLFFMPCLWSIDAYILMWEWLWRYWLFLPLSAVVFAVALACATVLWHRMSVQEVQGSASGQDTTRAHPLRLRLLDSLGATGQYLRLEILSVLRCKTLRQRFVMSMSVVVLFTLLIAYTPIYSSSLERNWWCLYCFMLYGVTSLQKVMGTEGNYISVLLVHKENILQLLWAKYCFNVMMLLVPFALMLPALLVGRFSLLMMLAYMLLTSGPAYFCLFQLAVDNRETVPLNAPITQQQKTNNFKQVLWSLAAFFVVPAVLVMPLYLLCGQTVAYVVTALVGLAFTLSAPLWLRGIYRRMMRCRYDNLQGFYATMT